MCFFLGECSKVVDRLDPIKIQLGDDWDFSVAPEDYLIDYEENNDKYCILGMSPSNLDLYILGDAFLRSYLSIYDFDNRRAGLAVHIYSNATVDPHVYIGNKWVTPLAIIVLVLVLGVVAILIYKFY